MVTKRCFSDMQLACGPVAPHRDKIRRARFGRRSLAAHSPLIRISWIRRVADFCAFRKSGALPGGSIQPIKTQNQYQSAALLVEISSIRFETGTHGHSNVYQSSNILKRYLTYVSMACVLPRSAPHPRCLFRPPVYSLVTGTPRREQKTRVAFSPLF